MKAGSNNNIIFQAEYKKWGMYSEFYIWTSSQNIRKLFYNNSWNITHKGCQEYQ